MGPSSHGLASLLPFHLLQSFLCLDFTGLYSDQAPTHCQGSRGQVVAWARAVAMAKYSRWTEVLLSALKATLLP